MRVFGREIDLNRNRAHDRHIDWNNMKLISNDVKRNGANDGTNYLNNIFLGEKFYSVTLLKSACFYIFMYIYIY